MAFFNKLFAKNQTNDLPEYDVLIQQSIEGLRLQTTAHDSTWHLGEASWSVDQGSGNIVFVSPHGITAPCPVQIIGTYNSLDNTFLWGWEHPSVLPALQEHARKVKAYGEQHNIAELTTQKITCTETKAWELTALACRLNEAQGAYRGTSGTSTIFMTFGTVSLSKTQ